MVSTQAKAVIPCSSNVNRRWPHSQSRRLLCPRLPRHPDTLARSWAQIQETACALLWELCGEKLLSAATATEIMAEFGFAWRIWVITASRAKPLRGLARI